MKLWFKGAPKCIYADAAAATPLSPAVLKEMRRLEPLFANPGGLHAEAVAAKKELERARERAAKAIGAHADELFFTSGGTEANNLALMGALRPLLHEHGELHAITTVIEHPSVLEALRTLEREGLYITYLPVDEDGRADPKLLREALNDETVLVSVQMVNSEMGAVQDIHEFAKEIRHEKRRRKIHQERGESSADLPLYFHCDASQAPLWLPVQVEKLGVDLLTLDAQKMMGPKGVGALYIKRGVELEPVLWGGGQERGLRSGTENIVLAGAFAQALVDAQAGVVATAPSIAALRDLLVKEIKKYIHGAELNGVVGEGRVANNVNISIPGLDAQMAVIALSAEGVAASTRSACSGADEEASYVIKALGKTDSQAKSSVRITLLPTATKRDVYAIVRALKSVADRYRNVV